MLFRDEHLTRRDLIDPIIMRRGWTADLIKIEKTPGGVDIVDGKPIKRKGRCDYLLCLPIKDGKSPLPVAILEAKKESLHASMGLAQAKKYCQQFHVPFAFSTNGHLFVEYAEDTDMITNERPLIEMPNPDELRHRYETYKQIKLESSASDALFSSYKGGEGVRRYYQDAAIRATLEKIAQGEKRCLLSLATGTGKTVIAKQLLYKIALSGQLTKALFLCDRDELRTNGIGHMNDVFGDDAQIVDTSNPHPNARVLVATYQTLNVSDEDSTPVFWKENFPPNYFSHIIIDECHRSAWSRWSVVLTDNPNAVQIGLTATPRIVVGGKSNTPEFQEDAEITANNVKYFGEPAYEYTISQGQNDGYLAACEVIRRSVDLDKKGLVREDIQELSVVDVFTGKKVNPSEIDEAYTAERFDVDLLLEDRMNAMSQDLFDLFLDTGGPHQKTIIFCASEYHAEQIAIKLQNIYTQWCHDNLRTPHKNYAFKCTSGNTGDKAKSLIPELRGAIMSHYIATTVDLLSTGVDIPNLQNVVFFKYIKSPILFYQMVGRGTRTGNPIGSKMMFRLYDYTNATRLFGEEFVSRATPTKPDDDMPIQLKQIKKIKVLENEFEIQIQNEGKSILCNEDGIDTLIPYEEYKKRLSNRLIEEVSSVDELRSHWVVYNKRRALLDSLPGGESAIRLIRELEDEQECDLYDVLAEVGFGYEPKSRAERASAFGYQNKDWLIKYPENTRKVLEAIAKQFEHGGIDELESDSLFDVQEIKANGGFTSLLRLPMQPNELINETKIRLLR
ncbi:MAG TPA: DEAD/DEAH box helicase family protein [Candidatus Cloacimonadota bacterium]|nr:DEAD/DEAH box helicase family protein [Candidatus Cloacimonadota bacterium]